MTREEAIYQLEDLKKEAMSHFWCEKDDCENDDKIHHRDAEATGGGLSKRNILWRLYDNEND